MAKFNLDNIWSVMKKYDFNQDNEIKSDLLCVLCQKLIINAYTTPCICRFCFDCISNYLNKEIKPCPGNTDICKLVLISLNERLLVDDVINNEISKLIVKCPEKSCEFKDELKNIENHIRNCNYQSVFCPYLKIGCNLSDMFAGNIIDHLQLEIGNHAKLLIDCIDNLNNEIKRLKIIVDKLEEENKMLNSETNKMKIDGERKQIKCDEQDCEINLLNEDMVALRNVDKYMRDDFNELKLDDKRKQEEIENLNKKMQEMESKFEIKNNSIIEKELEKLKFDGERKEKAFEELRRKCDEQTRKIDLLNDKIDKLRNVDECLIEHVEILKSDEERKKKDFEELRRKCDEKTRKINLMNQEIGKLKNIDKCLREDVDKLRSDEERKQKIFEELRRKCDEQTRKIDLLNEEINKLRNVDKCLIEHVENLKSDEEKKEKSIEILGNKCEQQNEQIQQFNIKYQQIANKFINVNQVRENKTYLMRNINEMKTKQTEIMTKSIKMDETIKNIEDKLLEMEINQNKIKNGEFLWKIDNINDKMKDAKSGINEAIYSESFYTHKYGYKMCLRVYPDGGGDGKGTHLSVFFYLMKGDFDDILQWPFKYDVTFSLIDQQTGLAHVNWTATYNNLLQEFDKPINDKNDGGLGFAKFIELNELLTSTNLIFNNQLFIKCFIKIP